MGSLIRPTNQIVPRVGGVWSGATPLIAGGQSGTIAAKMVYARVAGVWAPKYSTPTATVSGGGANSSSGASSSGTVSVNATVTPGGNHSGVLSYTWGGGGVLSYLNTTSATITAYHDFTGVANGSSSSIGPDTGLFCDVTDTLTGATWRTENITAGPLTWTNTIPAFGPFTAASSGGFGSGAGSFGPPQTQHAFVNASGSVGVGSGGPVSGNFSYSWFKEGGTYGSAIVGNSTLSNVNSSMVTVTFDWFVTAQNTDQIFQQLGVTMTDLTSGYSSTIHGVVFGAQYVNNTG